MSESTIEEIIGEFDLYDGLYKREAVEEALRLREEITPRLVRIFDTILADPLQYINEGHDAHIYAFVLLGHFREPKAHKLLIAVFSLPHDMVDALFGDMITELLPSVLYQTCNGSLTAVKEMAVNKNVPEYCRVAALYAMVYAVAGGVADRRDVLDFLATLFSGEEAEPGSFFWSGAAGCVDNLYPEELMGVINKAYKDGLIESDYIAPEDFQGALAMGKEKTLDAVRIEMQYRMPADIHKYEAWFEESGPAEDERAERPQAPPGKKAHGVKKKGKNKKKISKTSRKKNRR